MDFFADLVAGEKECSRKGKSATPINLTGTMHAVAGRIR
jgi:hypothetical protein